MPELMFNSCAKAKLLFPYILCHVFIELASGTEVQIQSCCSSQFSFRNGQCDRVGQFNVLKFPSQLFGKYSFRRQLPACKHTERLNVPITSLNLSHDGYFQRGRDYIPPSQYCVDSIGPKTAELIISSPSKCKLKSLKKCCELDSSYDVEKGDCVPTLETFRRHNETITRPNAIVQKGLECKLLRNFTNLDCWERSVRYRLEDQDSETGLYTLHYESQNGVFLRGAWKTLEGNYCVEKAQNYDDLCSGSRTLSPEIVFYCSEVDETSSMSYARLLGWLWIATAAFLFVAAFVNVTIVQRNVHGWVLFCYLLSSSLLNVVASAFVFIVDDNRVGCHFIDFATKFLYLSTLCWMSMVNFDLWISFRKMEASVKTSTKRLPFYLLFAWSVPALIIGLCWLVSRGQSLPRSHCFIFDYGLILYSSGPVVLLILCNLGLFIRTAMIIQGIRTATRKVLRSTSRAERESFRLFSKLFLMSGPIWVLRVVLLALNASGNYLTWYGLLMEVIFILPDLAFFLLVILHPKVGAWVRNALPCLQRVPGCRRASNEPISISRPNSESQPRQDLSPSSSRLERGNAKRISNALRAKSPGNGVRSISIPMGDLITAHEEGRVGSEPVPV